MEHPVGAVDIVVRSSADAGMLGVFTLRRDKDSMTWRLPIRSEYRTRRLALEPGLYALDFEPDVSAALEHGGAARPVRLVAGSLPRWVVVAPSRVTTVNVAAEIDRSIPGSAVTTASLPGGVPVN